VSFEDLKRRWARRVPALLVALCVGVAGVAWAGCGDSDSDKSVSEAQERAEKGLEEAKQGLQKGKDEAQKGIEKGKDEAQKGIEKGKDEAQRAIEEAEKYTE
jgi:hypothetical protein